MDRTRLESFSDGVFAVAITLLALNLTVDGPGHGSLPGLLATAWPAYVAYLISFFTIGIIWVNHHALVRGIAVVERSLLFVNLALLATVVAIPFTTSTMAAYLNPSAAHYSKGNASVATALYALVLEAMSLAFLALFEWTLRSDSRTHHPVPPAARWAARRRFYAGQIPYLVAAALAFASPPAALALTGLVAVYYMVERTPAAPTPQEP